MNTRFELMREHVDLKKSASVGLLADVVDKIVEELRLLADRVEKLEATLAKPRPPWLVYAGEWIPRFEYDSGNVVEYDNGLWVAVQPTNDGQPPQRGNGWVRLVQGA